MVAAATGGGSAELGLIRPAKRRQKSAVSTQVLPTTVVLRLLNDSTFEPGPRPVNFYLQQGSETQWIFKETILANKNRLKKRKLGSDTWVNSGGKRGGRALTDGHGVAVAHRRYGTIKTDSDCDAARLRYQQYTLIRNGEEDTRTRIFHVQEVSPNVGAPGGAVFTVPPEISLTQVEQEEIGVLSSSGKAKRDRPGKVSQHVVRRETQQHYYASHTKERHRCPKHPKLSPVEDTQKGVATASSR
jgi:hypothetical protein